jgi:hypothetical protein
MTLVGAGGPLDVDEAESWVRSNQPGAGPLELSQTEPWASVFRAPVNGHVVWFKACAPRHSFEVPLTAALSLRWKTMVEILPTYAELQIGETERAGEHVARGVPDLRIRRLPALYEELLRAELPIEAAERSALEAFRPPFSQLCEELDGAGIGPTVQHDDLHMNNVYVKDGSLRVLDWATRRSATRSSRCSRRSDS